MTKQQLSLDVGVLSLSFMALGYGLTGSFYWAFPYAAIMGASILLGQRAGQRKEDEFGFWRVSDENRKAVRKYEHSGDLNHLSIDSAVVAYDRAKGLADERLSPKLHALLIPFLLVITLYMAFAPRLDSTPAQQSAFVLMALLLSAHGIVDYRRRVAYQEKWDARVAEIDKYGRTLAFGNDGSVRT